MVDRRDLNPDPGADVAGSIQTGVAGAIAPAPPSLTTDSAARAPLLLDVATLALRACEAMVVAGSSILCALFLLEDLSSDAASAYLNAALISALFFVGLGEVTGCYDADVRFSVRRAWGRVLSAWLATATFLMTIGFLMKVSEVFSRGWAIAWFFSAALGLLTVRAAGTGWMLRMKRQGVFNQRVAIFGAGSQGDRLARYIQGSDKLTIDLIGFFDDRTAERLPARETKLPVVGKLDTLIEMIRRGGVDQVIVALPWSAEIRLQEVVAELAMTPVRIRLAPDLASFAFAQRPVVLLGDLPVMTLFERPISGFDQILKKIEDMILATVALLALSPLLLVCAIAIKLDSAGPVFFRQEREGFNNRRFRIWKFRSMRADKCETDGIVQATRADSRITRVGAFLRRTSIDELPQLFNVLGGEMSLVGPRPHAPSTRAGERLFSDVVSHYAARHNVKPGITGWAQVNGWRGETDTEEKLLKRLECDLYYVENWSVTLDLYIMLRTVATALFQRSAY